MCKGGRWRGRLCRGVQRAMVDGKVGRRERGRSGRRRAKSTSLPPNSGKQIQGWSQLKYLVWLTTCSEGGLNFIIKIKCQVSLTV